VEMYNAKSKTTKFVPIFFELQDERFIPEPLSAQTHYLLSSENNYANRMRSLPVGRVLRPVSLDPSRRWLVLLLGLMFPICRRVNCRFRTFRSATRSLPVGSVY
jgi:hypothetical protein